LYRHCWGGIFDGAIFLVIVLLPFFHSFGGRVFFFFFFFFSSFVWLMEGAGFLAFTGCADIVRSLE
jgi:acyl-CoA synthetase (AMP-forming)/AMP-acid ligase II